MSTVDRRAAQRHPADWAARYRYHPNSEWRSCRVVDVSITSAAVELHETHVHEPVTGLFFLQIRSVSGDDVGTTLRATLRRHARTFDDRVIAGVEFDMVHLAERNLLRLLVGLRASA